MRPNDVDVAAIVETRGRRDDRWQRSESVGKRRAFLRLSRICQENIEDEGLSTALADLLNDLGKKQAASRCCSLALQGFIVDCDKDDIRRGCDRANNPISKIEQSILQTIQPSVARMQMGNRQMRNPYQGRKDDDSYRKGARSKRWQSQRPKRARSASARAAPHFLTASGSPAVTSVPSPTSNVTVVGSFGRRTFTPPSNTKTDVCSAPASTTYVVPRTVAIACGVLTSVGECPGEILIRIAPPCTSMTRGAASFGRSVICNSAAGSRSIVTASPHVMISRRGAFSEVLISQECATCAPMSRVENTAASKPANSFK